MIGNYNMVIEKEGDWRIGWVPELPGVNSQGKTRDELIENLKSALAEALELQQKDNPCKS
jgi:predicted RNase H-like HicB family nuclease